jgi:hypothetical protein
VIPEPQRTYVLELLAALGPATGEFVIAGAQAIKFAVPVRAGNQRRRFYSGRDCPPGRASPSECSAETVGLHRGRRGAKFPV